MEESLLKKYEETKKSNISVSGGAGSGVELSVVVPDGVVSGGAGRSSATISIKSESRKVVFDIGGVLVPVPSKGEDDGVEAFDITRFMPGMIDVLTNLSERGLNLFICSYSGDARIKKTKADLGSVDKFTRLIDPANWHFVTDKKNRGVDKAKVCTELGAYIMVDDTLEICKCVQKAGTPHVFWYTAEGTKPPKGIIKVSNWAELLEKIESII